MKKNSFSIKKKNLSSAEIEDYKTREADKDTFKGHDKKSVHQDERPERNERNSSEVRAKKHLGQHFLRDEATAHQIVRDLTETDDQTAVIEVGPGMGVLTKYLLEELKGPFLALDLDQESVAYLKKTYPAHEDKFRFADFLAGDLKALCPGKFNVIGNFPYNISSQIMFRVLDYRNDVECVVGMFQKEVAERIAEKPGSRTYGILSVLMQAFYDIDYLHTVDENAFLPPPKVKSGVIRLRRNAVKELPCNEAEFFKVVKTTFNQRRKTIRNSIKPLLDERKLEHPLLDKRPEQLSVNEFVELTQLVHF